MSFFRSFKSPSKTGGEAADNAAAVKTSTTTEKITSKDPTPTTVKAETDTKEKTDATGIDTESSSKDAIPASTSEPDISKIKVADEPDEDPERAQLESVVRQRDAAVSALEKARQEKQVQLAQLEGELEKERLLQMKEALIHKIDTERIKIQTLNAEERLKSLEADMQDKAAIHEYANLIKGVAPKAGVDSQYVMKLQLQLQKAVKKMEATTEQMKEIEDSTREVIDALSKEIADLIEERCKTELELRKQMDVLEVQKHDMQLEYEERIKENLKTLNALKAKATKQTTIDELEAELDDTEMKLNELHRIQEKQVKTIEQLNKSLQQHQQQEVNM